MGKLQNTAWTPFKKRNNSLTGLPDFVLLALILSVLLFFWHKAGGLPQYDWNWRLLLDFLWKKSDQSPGLLLSGLFTTLRCGFWIFLFSLIPGMAAALLVSLQLGIFRFPAIAYVNLARNTPPLVLLFCFYFFAGNILPINGFEEWLRTAPAWVRTLFDLFIVSPGQVDRMIAAILALGLYEGAFIAEIIRSGLQSVSKSQWEAAYALGFTRMQTIRLVIIPQTVRFILPPLTGQLITTFKETALVSLISLPDLTFQSLEIMAITNMTFEVWLATGIIYLFLGFCCSLFGRFVEDKFSVTDKA